MLHNAIAIFVKTPGLSPVKTRLAADIGEDKALEFYKLCLSCVQETVQKTEAKIYWAVGEKDGMDNALWSGFDRLHTGEGNLGQRQSNIYNTLKNYHHNVMLLGADCPQITPEILHTALENLKSHDYVIGPARDGGYTFFAGHRPVSNDIWTNVEYSCEDTREQLLAKLENYWLYPRMLTDVDDVSDIKHMLDEMPEEPDPAQKKIIDWAKTI